MSAKPPTQSLEFVCGWFAKAATNAQASGKKDAALLWQDGLDQLLYIAAQRDDLAKALEDAVETIEAISGKDNSCDPAIDCGEFRALIDKAIGSAA